MNLDAANMSPLAKADGVALLTRKPIRAIYAMADGGDLVDGKLMWVWNVATNPAGDKRDLRFLIAESIAPARMQKLTLDQVINLIVSPKRREFPAGEVCALLQVRDITLRDLRAELAGSLRDGHGITNFYPRAGLVKFFQTRWLGATTNTFAPDKAAPLNSPARPGKVVSRVGNSSTTWSPAQKISGGRPC
jgi:hypothetical protein